jgi:hypothetical protein
MMIDPVQSSRSRMTAEVRGPSAADTDLLSGQMDARSVLMYDDSSFPLTKRMERICGLRWAEHLPGRQAKCLTPQANFH